MTLSPARGLKPRRMACLPRLLGRGGDSRAVTDPKTGLNPYYCAPYPMKNVSVWSSCTASPPSPRGFLAAQRLWKRLAQKNKPKTSFGANEAARRIQKQLREILGYRELRDYGIILSPSGTDAEAIPLAWVLATEPGPIRNIFMAPLELGQGSALAGSGRYFDSRLPNGRAAKHGQPFVGSHCGRIRNSEIHIRDSRGLCLPHKAVEKKLNQVVGQGIRSGEHILLRLVDSSKTGACTPSLDFIRRLCGAHPGRLTILVDAAQGRWRPHEFQAYLEEGYFVLISGSKFFGGPPFCGAALMPQKAVQRLFISRNRSLFLRLASTYLTRADFEEGFNPFFGGKNSMGRRNIGLLLRWQAALAEMRAFFSIPRQKRETLLGRMSREASSAVSSSAKLALAGPGCDPYRTIFTFLVYSSSGKERPGLLGREQLAELRKKLFHAGLLLGKPVRLSPPGTRRPGEPEYWGLRFALSVPMLVQAAQGKGAWKKWLSDLKGMVAKIQELA